MILNKSFFQVDENTNNLQVNSSLSLVSEGNKEGNTTNSTTQQPTTKHNGTISDWFYGPSDFVWYMNTVYKRFHRENVQFTKKRIVYEKKGTTGMAGQMFGVCDALFLGVLHKRVVQSK